MIDTNGEKRALVLDNIQDVLEAYSLLNNLVKMFVSVNYEITWAQVSMIDPTNEKTKA